jgi:homoserine kinase type II
MAMGNTVIDRPQDLSRTDPVAPGVTIGSLAVGSSRNDDTGVHRAFTEPAAETAPETASASVEGYERFAVGELAMVCSHYELGVISSIREFRRGSRRAPKVVMETGRGSVLIKRRAAGRDAPGLVAFSHGVQHALAARHFPLARLIRTRDARTGLFLGGSVYEVFEFIAGTHYDRSEGATAEAGRALAYLHRLSAGLAPAGQPPVGSYHAAPVVTGSLRQIPARLGRRGLVPLCDTLARSYDQAAARVRDLGLAGWPRQVIHCDYHPGNLIFGSSNVGSEAQAAGAVRAVVDFDACRIGPRALDVANGALQFSVTRSGPDPTQWPVEPDTARLAAFLHAYDGVEGCLLSRAEVRALPWLMVQALIAEAALPVLATGRFGGLDGGAFLEVVEGKARCIAESHERIASL